MKDRRIDKRPLYFCAAGYKGWAYGGWYGREWIMCLGANNLQTCCSEDRYCMWMWVGWRTKSALVICLRAIFPLVQVTCWPWMSQSAFGFVTPFKVYSRSLMQMYFTLRWECTVWHPVLQCSTLDYAKSMNYYTLHNCSTSLEKLPKCVSHSEFTNNTY